MKRSVIYLDKDRKPARRRYFKDQAQKVANKFGCDAHPAHGKSGLRIVLNEEICNAEVDHLIILSHGWPDRFFLRTSGVHKSRSDHRFFYSADDFAGELVVNKVVSRYPKISLCSCMCGRNPRWYMLKVFGRSLSPWGPASYRDGGHLSIAARLRDSLVDRDYMATVRAHTAAGDTLRIALLREFLPLVAQGTPLFGRVFPGVEPSLRMRRWWVRNVTGDLAKRLLLFDDSAITDIREIYASTR